jgi:hypothetical protein
MREFITALFFCLLSVALTVLVMAHFTKQRPPTEALQPAIEKVETVRHVAYCADRIAVEARPKVEAARRAASFRLNAHALSLAAELAVPDANTTDTTGTTDSGDTAKTTIAKEITTYNGRNEDEPLLALLDALETQLVLEVERGDAWKELAEAQQVLIESLQDDQASAIKAAHRKGLRRGALGCACLVVLLVIL